MTEESPSIDPAGAVAGPRRHPASDRLRERLQVLGEVRLSDAECLGLVLGAVWPGDREVTLAQRVLSRCGGLAGLALASSGELLALPGVGPTRAAALGAALGLARRIAESRLRLGGPIRDARDVAAVVRETARPSRREAFFALLLDTRHRVLGLRMVSVGSLDSAPVHPREVFGPAVREGAAALILAHNHPSGDPRPSVEDERVTERLRAAGELLGIEVLDHVVVGVDRYFSFADQRFRALS